MVVGPGCGVFWEHFWLVDAEFYSKIGISA
jgi:hypothetical protein